jgi:hypothetical protein
MDLKLDRRMRESAMIATLTVLTVLLLPLLVIVGTVLYVASVVRLNVIVFGECAQALRAWASGNGDAA